MRGQANSSGSIKLPRHFHRIDKWLPDIANRLTAIHSRLTAIHTELLGLPGAVRAELGVSVSDYGKALDYLAALPRMLKTAAEARHRKGRGNPSLEFGGHAIGLLICAVEDYTGEKFLSPRSNKRQAEIELVRLLAAKLFPSHTPENINTMLGHFPC